MLERWTRTMETWGATEAELGARYPCDELLPDARARWVRGVDVRASPATVFAWVCQLRAAPYSYDLVDNLGRRSPRTRQAWCEDLAVGQRAAVVFEVADFERDRHLTLRLPAGTMRRPVGEVAMTYAVTPGPQGSRLVSAMLVEGRGGRLGVVLERGLLVGDVVMMRKQLLTLAGLAEAEAASAV